MTLKVFRETIGRAYPTAVIGEVRLASITGIDATSIASTNLYTVPSGETIVVTGVELRCTEANSITVAPTAGVGIASGEDDIIESQLLSGLTTSGKVFRFPIGGSSVIALATEVIKLGIDTGATGSSMTIEASIFGYTPE